MSLAGDGGRGMAVELKFRRPNHDSRPLEIDMIKKTLGAALELQKYLPYICFNLYNSEMEIRDPTVVVAERYYELWTVDSLEEFKTAFLDIFECASVAFGVTDFWELLPTTGPDEAFEGEIQQGKNLAKAAAPTPTLEHYVWSTFTSAITTSKGALSVPHCDSKARVDDYIFSSLPDLAKKTTFFWAGFYATNLGSFLPPVKQESGKRMRTWAFSSVRFSRSQRSLSPQRLSLGRSKFWRWGEVNGVKTVFVEKDAEEYAASFFAGPVFGKELALNMKFFEFGLEGWAKSGEKIFTKEDLGIDDAELVSTKQAFERIDWNSIVKA
ncbi:hypothetical protein DFS33DRAFT_1439206 [Desarmillaria ectypa]|nr:hypothetical protein DFS33DRAFT_1439206 [Desarmillaria ectypa]